MYSYGPLLFSHQVMFGSGLPSAMQLRVRGSFFGTFGKHSVVRIINDNKLRRISLFIRKMII